MPNFNNLWPGTRLALTLAALSLTVACGQRAVSAAEGWSAADRTELLARLVTDQAVRDTLLMQLNSAAGIQPALVASMNAIDSANQAWLKPRLEARGWPTRKELGKDGVEAVFLMVQHADRDPAFQAAMLPKIDSAYQRGEIEGQSLALLTDRVAKAQGKPQIYGTQTTSHGRKLFIDPIEDSANVDARRAKMGLPPLAVYKHMLDSMVANAGRN